MSKTIRFFGLLILLVLLLAVTPFVGRTGEKLIPYYDYETRLYGYCTLYGDIRIPPRFSYADEFASNGLACVCEPEALYGYINTSGEYAIKPAEHISPERFQDNGLVSVNKPKPYGFYYGFMNSRGELVTEIKYDYAYPFSKNGLAVVEKDGEWGYINEQGEEVIELKYGFANDFAKNGLAAVCEDGKYGFINQRGEYVIEPQFDMTYGFGKDGLALVCIGEGKEGKWGFIDESGEYVIEPQFDGVSEFSENGLANFYVGEAYDEYSEMHYKRKHGFISRDGEIIIEPQYEFAYNFADNGLAAVRNELADFMFITKDGSLAFDGEFWMVQPDSYANCGLAAVEVKTEDGYFWGYIDETGEFVIEPRFNDAANFREDGLARVSLYIYEDDGSVCWVAGPPMLHFYINTSGEIIAPQSVRNTPHVLLPVEW